MLSECIYTSGGGGGFFQKFTASTSTEIEIDLGHPISYLVVYTWLSGVNGIIIRYDMETDKVMQTGNGGFEYDNTSFFGPSFRKSGDKMYYKAINSGYAVPTAIIAW